MVTAGRVATGAVDRGALRRRGRGAGGRRRRPRRPRRSHGRRARWTLRSTSTATSRARPTGPRSSAALDDRRRAREQRGGVTPHRDLRHSRRAVPEGARRERARHVPRDQGGDRADEGRGRRLDRQHLLDRRPLRHARHRRLFGEQVRGARPHQDRRPRARPLRHPREHGVPGGRQPRDGDGRAAARLRLQARRARAVARARTAPR